MRTKSMNKTCKKYELTDETVEHAGRTLHRIRALIDFTTADGVKIHAGDLGGYVEKYKNLSQNGSAWVGGDAHVDGSAWVDGDACVGGDAHVGGNACVSGDARVSGSACVFGDAHVDGNAWVCGNACVFGDARVSGSAWVDGNARVSGSAWVGDNNHILTISNIGSRGDTTTFFRGADNKIHVTCGCFCGTIDEFANAVDETHGNSKHGQTYRKSIEIAKLNIELNMGDEQENDNKQNK